MLLRVTRSAVVAIAAIGALLIGSVPAHAVVGPLPIALLVSGALTLGPGVADHAFENNADTGSTAPGFGVNDVEEDTGRADAFDDGMHLTLNGTPFRDADNNVDVSPNTPATADPETTTASGRIGKLSVTARFHLFGNSINLDRVRVLYTVKNLSKTRSKRVTALYSHDLGSGIATVVENSSDGDAALEAGDSWVVTSDDGSVDDDVINDAVNTFALGTVDQVITEYPEPTGDLQAKFRFKIRPRKKVQLLFFHQFEDGVVSAEIEALDFNDLASLSSAGLLTGLNGRFVNWPT